jgi:arylsulfatase A-like enzyme
LSAATGTGVDAARGADHPSNKPNIVFLFADDLGYGDLGCYGQKTIRTPNLDRLAVQGTRFTDCYAGSTVCAPSRCSLMTGYHMGHAHIRGNVRVPLRYQDKTVAEVLKAAGYTTGIIGKWGIGEPGTTGVPTQKGFDEWFGYLNQHHAHDYYPTYLWRDQQRVELQGNLDGRKGQYSHDLFIREAESFLERHHAGPFFLYLPLTIPHANNELGGKTGNGMEVPSDAPYSNEDWPQPQKNHAAMITRLDRDIGRLLTKLDELGVADNTVVFFTSDNGPHREGGADPEFFDSNGALRGIKRDLYEGGIRVPMIVRWPGKVPAGASSDQVWAFWDFLPTAAEIAGAASPAGIDGISMLPALLGKAQTDHEYLYWEFYERAFKQAARMGPWKGVRTKPGQALELYNLDRDIGEADDIAGTHPEVVAIIEKIFKTARTEWEHAPKRRRR